MGMFYTSKREKALLAEINFWHLKYVELADVAARFGLTVPQDQS